MTLWIKTNWLKIQMWREERRIAEINYMTVGGPALGVIKLLEAHKHNPDLNVALALRMQDWCWSTFDHIGTRLGKYYDVTHGLLLIMDQACHDFDWDSAKYTTDYYSDAARFYEENA